MKIKLILVASAFSSAMLSQPTVPYWKLGGNSIAPSIDAVSTTNNFLGTAGGNNTSLRIGTAGISRLFVNQGTNSFSGLLGVGNTGYLGIGNNVTTPRFHLDINTQALPGQAEVFIGAGPTDVPGSKMGLMNAASGNSTFVPYVYGKTDASQNSAALTTLANIDVAQDVGPSTNPNPVQMFRVGSGFNFYTSSVGAMNNRLAFTWVNGASTNMVMNAGGRVGIGNNLTIPTNLPNNRLELTASTGDPYFIGTTGASGLRFTNLTSAKPTTPNGTNGVNNTKVLTVDMRGDVVLTDAAAVPTTNNGISINTAGIVQLGVPCTLPGGAPNFPGLSASQLTADRAIYTANQNFWFGNANTETGGVGVGGHPTLTGWCNTGNTFEISANSKNTKYGSTNASGLRLTKLLSTSPTVANGNNGVNNSRVLTVDKDGDVVLTDVNNAVGNYCSAPTQNLLTGNYEIPMNIYNYYFSGQGTGKTNVGVGLPCGTNLGGKVHAYQLANNFFYGSSFGVSIAGRFDNYTSTNAYLGYGVIGNSQAAASGYNIGVYGNATGAAVANYAGYFQGDVYTTGGTNSIAGYLSGSDKNIKTNITTINSNLQIINLMRPVSFKFDNTYAPQLKLNTTKNYGFIAQEIEAILPDIVSTTTVLPTFNSAGQVINPEKIIKALNYDAIIPFAIGGIQELSAKNNSMQTTIDSLRTIVSKQDSINNAVQQQLAALAAQINSCCANASVRQSNSTINQLDIELSDKDAIVLNQNVPNPFAEQTTITYNVPESVGKAQLIFFNTNGQVIQTVDIKTRGKGKVNVFASDLSSGLYNYTLVADGKVIDSKKMVRE